MSRFIPRGYSPLETLRDQVGVTELRQQLLAGEEQVVRYDEVGGHLHAMLPNEWLSDSSERWLENGHYGFLHRWDRLLIKERKPAAASVPRQHSDKAQYVSPHIELMLRAIRQFSISEVLPTGRDPETKQLISKEVLRDYFLSSRLSTGAEISPNLANVMATLCRPPEAMKGGNKRV